MGLLVKGSSNLLGRYGRISALYSPSHHLGRINPQYEVNQASKHDESHLRREPDIAII
jgi:hypothetical protein